MLIILGIIFISVFSCGSCCVCCCFVSPLVQGQSQQQNAGVAIGQPVGNAGHVQFRFKINSHARMLFGHRHMHVC